LVWDSIKPISNFCFNKATLNSGHCVLTLRAPLYFNSSVAENRQRQNLTSRAPIHRRRGRRSRRRGAALQHPSKASPRPKTARAGPSFKTRFDAVCRAATLSRRHTRRASQCCGELRYVAPRVWPSGLAANGPPQDRRQCGTALSSHRLNDAATTPASGRSWRQGGE
jgi:hypothetical protein